MNRSFLLILATLTLVACEKKGLDDYPDSFISYEEFVREVGCDNPYTDARAKDIFNTKYRDHVMTWTGEVYEPKTDSVVLDMDGELIASKRQVRLKFVEKGAGYRLKKGDIITVRFLIEHRGGCVLPVRGKYAQIIK
ncbi:MAG: hypothetical protein PVH46_06755 [Granulosicoccaceae bacterium]|jgi:hypothetical protein